MVYLDAETFYNCNYIIFVIKFTDFITFNL